MKPEATQNVHGRAHTQESESNAAEGTQAMEGRVDLAVQASDGGGLLDFWSWSPAMERRYTTRLLLD